MRARRSTVVIGLATMAALASMPVRAGAGTPDPFDHGLADVAVVAADDVWAVGDDLIVHWDGAAWTVTGPSIMRAHTYAAVAARNAADVWVVGWVVSQDQNVPLLLHYDGATWTRFHVARPPGEGMLNDVVVMPGGVAWAVGAFDLYTPNGSRNGGLAYRFDGHDWVRVGLPTRVATLTAATPSGRTGLWAVGMVETPLWHPAALRWNGRGWRVDRLPEYERNTFATDVVSLGHGRLTVVGLDLVRRRVRLARRGLHRALRGRPVDPREADPRGRAGRRRRRTGRMASRGRPGPTRLPRDRDGSRRVRLASDDRGGAGARVGAPRDRHPDRERRVGGGLARGHRRLRRSAGDALGRPRLDRVPVPTA